MTFLPIVERELRAHARRGRTYWTRFLVALLGTTICLLESPSGRNMFESLVTVTFVWCCFVFVLTADVISSERREGTLGLLFLTRVRSADVLLGKLASAGLTSLFALAAFLPALMLPVLSGGVTGGEVFRKGLMLLDTLFLVLAVGLGASARGTEWLRTTRAAALTVLGILLLPPCLEMLLRQGGLPRHTVGLLSPLVGMITAGDLAFRTSASLFWTSFALVQAFGWLMLLRARLDLRRSLAEPPDVSHPATVVAESAAVASEPTTPFPRRLPIGDEPIAWLLRRQRGVRPIIWAAVIFGGVFYLGPYFFFGVVRTGGWGGTVAGAWSVSLFSSVITGCLFAWAAGRFFLESRKTGALELLVTTPLGASTIVSAQWSWLKRILSWPLVVMVLPILLPGCSMVFSSRPYAADSWAIHYAIAIVLGTTATVVGVLVLCWLGMWFGLHLRTPSSAIAHAVVWGKVVPFIIGLMFSLVLAPLLLAFTPPMFGAYFIRSWLPSVAILAFYVWLLKRIRERLRGELRDSVPLARQSGEYWADSLVFLRRARHWTPADSI